MSMEDAASSSAECAGFDRFGALEVKSRVEHFDLPHEFILRVVVLSPFLEWVRVWRRVCSRFALPPEWFAAAASWSNVIVLQPHPAEDLSSAIAARSSSADVADQGELVILLRPGLHEGPLLISRPCSVIGWGAQGTVQIACPRFASLLNGQEVDASVWLSDTCGDARVLNLTIDVRSCRTRRGYAVVVAGGAPTVAKCALLGGGVALRGGMPSLAGCSVESSDGHGVLVEAACSCPWVRDCEIRDSRRNGIHLEARACVERCVIERSGIHGIHAAAGVGISEAEVRRQNLITTSGQ
eukprot:TRINITY_DN45870_c0_g1_i1.p1 TRINITY_DN45870_c0_g1~~TRINITY_DN45870_c0_g1_i1.p1  ORF type:complete len:297 (-),score=37.11 TRINITY_DN45870_c0_g1_i1:409-1299(-)